LIKRGPGDGVGVWEQDDVSRILEAAGGCDPRVETMWAGGLDGRQVYWLAQKGAFGIFTTSTTARRVAVVDPKADPAAASELEPTYYGVLAVRMVIEAGFLRGVAEGRDDPHVVTRLDDSVEPVLRALESGLLSAAGEEADFPVLDVLRLVLEPLWRTHLSTEGVEA
jgi:hypothetical protein